MTEKIDPNHVNNIAERRKFASRKGPEILEKFRVANVRFLKKFVAVDCETEQFAVGDSRLEAMDELRKKCGNKVIGFVANSDGTVTRIPLPRKP